MGYAEAYRDAMADPAAFWMERAKLLDWDVMPGQAVATDDQGVERWFTDGVLNTCFNAVDRHVISGRGAQPAIHYDSPVSGSQKTISYSELEDLVSRAAGGLKGLGVGKGDRVVLYMPMVPEAVITMLACARLGAVHSVVFGGFAATELAVRLTDAEPRIVVTASCGLEASRVIDYMPIVAAALDMTTADIDRVVVLERPQQAYSLIEGRDVSWHALINDYEPAGCTPVSATDPLYILYTSGTTGKPKGVVRDNGGHAVALAWSMSAVYGVSPGDVFWAASDIGWVVGHSYIVYAPLLMGCTSVLYEGKPVNTPDAGAFWRVVSDYRVRVLFAAPTAFRAIRKEDPSGRHFGDYDVSCLEALFLAGERLDPPTLDWLQTLTQRPVIDHWWQTETGWAIASNPLGLQEMPIKPGSATVPLPGYCVEILDAEGTQVPAGEQGAVVIRRPLPPGCLPTLWRDAERYESSYLARYPGYFLTGDGGFIDDDGYLFIMGRTDDVINVAGHRLSTGEMEEIVAGHRAVAECAVIGVADTLKGQLPVGLVVLKDGQEQGAGEIERELVHRVRDLLGAVACFNRALIVDRLPKTRSGKILRATLRGLANGEAVTPPSTIEDPVVLDEIAALLKQHP